MVATCRYTFRMVKKHVNGIGSILKPPIRPKDEYTIGPEYSTGPLKSAISRPE